MKRSHKQISSSKSIDSPVSSSVPVDSPSQHIFPSTENSIMIDNQSTSLSSTPLAPSTTTTVNVDQTTRSNSTLHTTIGTMDQSSNENPPIGSATVSSTTASTTTTATTHFKTDFPLHETKRIFTRGDILYFLQNYLPSNTNIEEDAIDLINVLCLEFFSFLYQETSAQADIRYQQEKLTNTSPLSSSSLSSSSSLYGLPPENPPLGDIPDGSSSGPSTVSVRSGKSSSHKSSNTPVSILSAAIAAIEIPISSSSSSTTTVPTLSSKPLVQATDIDRALDTLGFHSIGEVLRIWHSQQYLPTVSKDTGTLETSAAESISMQP